MHFAVTVRKRKGNTPEVDCNRNKAMMLMPEYTGCAQASGCA